MSALLELGRDGSSPRLYSSVSLWDPHCLLCFVRTEALSTLHPQSIAEKHSRPMEKSSGPDFI